MNIFCLTFGREQEKLRNSGVHMLPNFWSRTGKIEEGDEYRSYLTFGQEQEKLRKAMNICCLNFGREQDKLR